MGSTVKGRRSRRGAALVLVAVSVAALAAMGALAIDLGMLFKARSDAQRAAEAGALAGASAFVEFAADAQEARDTANVRAYRFAQSNAILNKPVSASEVQEVLVISDSQKVRVVVGRPALGTWFAKLVGVGAVAVNASAAAVAVPAGGGDCVRPFAVPDTWNELDERAGGDQLEEDGEDWSYTPGQDSYSPGNPDQPSVGDTGYGSELRNPIDPVIKNDFGRPISLRLPDPANPTPPTGPRQFRPFSTSTSGNANDPTDYREHIEGCDPASVQLGQQYQLVNPDPQIPVATQQGVDSLYDADPGAKWDVDKRSVTSSAYGNWRNSPRIIKVGFFDPSQLGQGQTVTLNNIGLIFIETRFDQVNKAINGRFLYFATGSGEPSPNAGTLVKRLRLVE